MSALAENRPEETRIHLAGAWVYPLPEGALWWPEQGVLVVSDLHFEKGSSFARRGQMLPPYDTAATLDVVESLCRRLAPKTVISLGDSFHDRGAETRLGEGETARIQALTAAHDWVWVEGNHDPDPPQHLGGRASKALEIGPLVFRHEPTGTRGEVAGHLHPAAKVRRRGRSVRRRCFASDGERLVMPAMGAFTGGLNVHDPAIRAVFPEGLMAFAMGDARIFVFGLNQLTPDTPPPAGWRL
ncbi:MAG: ligase-associated DNA damage response endonuclease PdeM [Pseudomonadota bacterium]